MYSPAPSNGPRGVFRANTSSSRAASSSASFTPSGTRRTGLHRPIRHRGAVRRAEGVHRRGNRRSGTLGRALLLPAIRRLRTLRTGSERPHAGRSAISGMGADAIRDDRRSEGRRRSGAHRRAGEYVRSCTGVSESPPDGRSCWKSSTACLISTRTRSAYSPTLRVSSGSSRTSNNYVNLYPGDAPVRQLGGMTLRPTGSNSGFLGLPGDATPPSRFVRAAFYRATAPQRATAFDTVLQCFHLLNYFDIPIGIEHPEGECPTSRALRSGPRPST